MTATGVPGHLTQGSATRGGIGESTLRPDGTLKVTGEFAYASDMWHEDMLWGHTLRSPHAHARIVSVDTGEALAQAGVYAVLTHDDLPAEVKNYGLEIQDTPALAHGRVRHHGEPVALVAADHPETARRAAAKIKVVYEELPLVTDEASATAPARPCSTRAATTTTPRTPRTRTSCTASPSSTATSRRAAPRPTSWSPANTSSACRTRRSSAPSRGSRCPPRTAASTCTSPPSGSTPTCGRSPPSSACPRRRSA